jgi:hypothetical protein
MKYGTQGPAPPPEAEFSPRETLINCGRQFGGRQKSDFPPVRFHFQNAMFRNLADSPRVPTD